jgi:hypothetical protein
VPIPKFWLSASGPILINLLNSGSGKDRDLATSQA